MGNTSSESGGELGRPTKRTKRIEKSAERKLEECYERYMLATRGQAEHANFQTSSVQQDIAFPKDEILKILDENPKLSSFLHYDSSGNYHSNLFYFLKARCDLVSIKRVCEMAGHFYKLQCGLLSFDGIQAACTFATQKGVFEYLIQEYPNGAKCRSARGHFPVHFLLFGDTIWRTEEEILQMLPLLLQAYPEVITRDECILLSAVMHCDFGNAIHQCICTSCDQLDGALVLVVAGVEIDLDQAVLIGMLLEKFTELDLRLALFTSEGLQYLLASLAINTTIKLIKWELPRVIFSELEMDKIGAFKDAFANTGNTALKKIIFSMYDSMSDDHSGQWENGELDAFFRTINGIALNRTTGLEEMGIVNLDMSSPHMAALLSDCQVPNLWLSSDELKPRPVSDPFGVHSTSKLTNLVITSDDLSKALPALVNIRTLQRLTLHYEGRNSIDVTTTIIPLLNRGLLLKLSLKDLTLDGSALEQSLMSDRTLQTLEIINDPWKHTMNSGQSERMDCCNKDIALGVANALECGNTTLTRVKFFPLFSYSRNVAVGDSDHVCERIEKIRYFTMLNEHGRGSLFNLDISRKELVGFLCRVACTNSVSSSLTRRVDFEGRGRRERWERLCNHKHNILYAFLRCTPSLWCLPRVPNPPQDGILRNGW